MSERSWEKIEHGSFILANLLAASLEEWQWLPQWFMCMCLASTKLEQAYIMKMGWQQCNNATFPHCFALQSSLWVAWLKFDHVPHLDIPLDHVGHCPSHELNYCCFPHAELFSYTVLKTSFFLLIIPNLHIKQHSLDTKLVIMQLLATVINGKSYVIVMFSPLFSLATVSGSVNLL